MSSDDFFATTYGLVRGGNEDSAGQDPPAEPHNSYVSNMNTLEHDHGSERGSGRQRHRDDVGRVTVTSALLNGPRTGHGRAVDWVRRHQLVAFYLMTFSLSWSLGIVYAITDSDAFAPLVAVAACGPALAAITITGLVDRTGTLLPRRDFWRAFLLAWPIAAVVLLLGWATLEESEAPFAALALFSFVIAVPVTFVLASVRSQRPAVRHFMSSLIKVRGVGRWLLVAVVFIPGLLLLAQWTDQALGEPWHGLDLPSTGWALVGLILVKFAYQLLYFNATGEEVGWRGFALPRFQARTSPLVAAIAIGILWAPWHFWLWESEDKEVWTVEFWLDMSSAHILFSVLLVWMCNRAGGSILVAGVGHAATNTAFEYLTGLSGLGIQLTWLGAALLLIVSERMWRRLPSDHPVVYRPGSASPSPPPQADQSRWRRTK